MANLSRDDLKPLQQSASGSLQVEGTAEDLYQQARNADPKDPALIMARYNLMRQAGDAAFQAERAYEAAILDSPSVRNMLEVLTAANDKLKHEADALAATAQNLKETAAALGVVTGIVTSIMSFAA